MDAPWSHDPFVSDLVVHLQDAMLPTDLPVPQGVTLAARYLLADDLGIAGGDWFDAIVLDDGRVVACVGDVPGAGPAAAIAMGDLRTVFGERVRDRGDIACALDALERLAGRAAEARGATVCVVALDPWTGDLTYCTAGHPPPIVVDASGRASYLPTTGATALGGGAAGGFRTAEHHVAPGDIVLLYSDGLVERPGRTSGQSTAELLWVVAQSVAGPHPETDEPLVDRVCRQVLDVLVDSTGYRDDIAMLAVQRVQPTPPLSLVLPAVPDSASTARADLGEWLARLHVTTLDDLSVRHAVGELVANAVEHAYVDPDVHDQARVRVELGVDGVLELEVADDGAWRAGRPSPGDRGRGLALVRGITDELRVQRGTDGTRVTVRHRLRRPAVMLRGVAGEPRGDEAGRSFRVDVDGTQVRARGDVGDEEAEQLRTALDRSSQAGTRAIDVDLSGVSLLGSSGVQVLVEARAAGDVRLRTPVGSAAQHVLELVHVPYET